MYLGFLRNLSLPGVGYNGFVYFLTFLGLSKYKTTRCFTLNILSSRCAIRITFSKQSFFIVFSTDYISLFFSDPEEKSSLRLDFP